MDLAHRFRTQPFRRLARPARLGRLGRLGVSQLLSVAPVAPVTLRGPPPRPGRPGRLQEVQVPLLPRALPLIRASQALPSPRLQVVLPRILPQAGPPVLLLRLPLRRPLPRFRPVTPCGVTILCRLLGLCWRSPLPLRSQRGDRVFSKKY